MKTKSKGVFKQDNKGIWYIDTKIKVDGEYRHFKRYGYDTLSSAKADFERAKAEFIKSKSKHWSVMTFDDLIMEYENMRKVIVDESTLGCDKGCFNVYMLPYFKGKTLKEVFNTEVIKTWYHEIVDNTKYSQNKKSKVITRIKDLLKFSYMHKYIDAPTYQDCDVEIYQVKYSKKPNVERVVWTDDEEQAFLTAIKDNAKDDLMFRLFLLCSARLGEFLALMPSCFDYKKRKITIKQQVKQVYGKGATLTEKLKTHDSYRTIIIGESIANELKEYIDTLSLQDNDYIFFGNTHSIPIARTTFRRKLYMYCDKANIRRINPHASRHLQACKLASVCHTGKEIETAAHRLGHSVSVFMDTYANHRNEETENELLERLGQA